MSGPSQPFTGSASRRPLRFGPFVFDTGDCRLSRDGIELHLTPKAAAVLRHLLEHPGELIGKDEFLETVWEGVHVREESLTQAISVIRQMLGDSAQSPRYIQTVSGEGYRFVGEVRSENTPLRLLAAGEVDAREAHARPNVVSESTGVAGLDRQRPSSSKERSPGRSWRSSPSSLTRTVAVAVVLGLLALGARWMREQGVSPAHDASFADMTRTPATSLEGEEREPALSPDGAWVAFIWDGGQGYRFWRPGSRSERRDLYVMQLGVGGAPQPLSEGPRLHAHPTWSPDGNRVAFARRTPGRPGYEIVTIPAGGGLEQIVYSHPECGFPNGLDWSPDGKFLAFPNTGGHLGESADCPSGGQSQGIVLLEVETRSVRQLTFVPVDTEVAYRHALPAFSPQGGRLAFRRSQARGGSTDLFTISLDGEDEPRPLVIDAVGIQGLDWMPDGESIVYAEEYTAAENFLRVVRADGTGRPTTLNVGVRARGLSIADRMNRLIYSEPQERYNLYSIGGPTAEKPGAPVKLPASSTYDEMAPDFSPNGDKLTFVSDRSGTSEVWVADFPLGTARQLSDLGFANYPQWSPDGREIAFGSETAVDPDAPLAPRRRSDVYIVAPETGEPTNLTDSQFEDTIPGWSPDGKWIYFQSDRAGGARWELWRIPRAGGEPIKVTVGGDLVPRPLGERLYFHRSPGRIFSASLAGGDEQVFADLGVGAGNWDVWQGKVVYMHPTEAGAAIRIFDPETGIDREYTTIPVVFSGVRGNIWNVPTVSSDGRWIVYSGTETAGSDLIRLDNFR